MDSIEALSQARDEFESRLLLVGSDQWELETPCSDWTVRDLVNHILLGTRMSVQLLGGESRDDVVAGLDDDLVGDDPVATFRQLADQMHEGFSAPGAWRGP